MVSSAGGRRSRLLYSLLAVALVSLAALTACSGEKSSNTVADEDTTATASGSGAGPTSTAPAPTSSSAAAPWPSCAEVWVADAEFPQKYPGCVEGDDRVRAEKMYCSSGQVIVTYADRFYAVQGKHVNETAGLSGDASYSRAKKSCLA